MKIRYVIRDGIKILQCLCWENIIEEDGTHVLTEVWRDVQLCDETTGLEIE